MVDKQRAHDLLDRLAPGELAGVVRLLEGLIADGDTVSDSERRAIIEADEWLKHNQPFPLEMVLSEFGIDLADWEQMAEEADREPS